MQTTIIEIQRQYLTALMNESTDPKQFDQAIAAFRSDPSATVTTPTTVEPEKVETPVRQRAKPKRDPNSLYRRLKTLLDESKNTPQSEPALIEALKQRNWLRAGEETRVHSELSRASSVFAATFEGKWLLKKYLLSVTPNGAK